MRLNCSKKTLPGSAASLIEVRAATVSRRSHALAALRAAHVSANSQDKPGLELLMLTLSGKKSAGAGGFDKVVKMIDDMVALLKKEQDDDEHKKEYCALQFDASDDQKKSLERKIAGEASAISSAQESLSTLGQEIAALQAGVVALDKAVAEATSQRKDENAEYKALIASNTV